MLFADTITQQPDLSMWPCLIEDKPTESYLHFVEGVYHSPYGTVEVKSWQGNPNCPHLASIPAELVTRFLGPTGKRAGYTALRMVHAGKGWAFDEARYWPLDSLVRLAKTFALVVAKQAQQPASKPTGFGSLQPMES